MTRKIVMAAVKAVIELLAHNASYSQIRRELGVSKGFISKVAFVIKADGKTPEQFLLLSDAEIRSKVYPDSRKKRTEPNWEDVADKLQRKHMTLQLLYEDYCQNNPEKHYSYPSYCRLYADWCKTHQATGGYCNLEHVPGDVVEIDFAGDPRGHNPVLTGGCTPAAAALGSSESLRVHGISSFLTEALTVRQCFSSLLVPVLL